MHCTACARERERVDETAGRGGQFIGASTSGTASTVAADGPAMKTAAPESEAENESKMQELRISLGKS